MSNSTDFKKLKESFEADPPGNRNEAYFEAGYCYGLYVRKDITLYEFDKLRELLRITDEDMERIDK